MLPVVPFSKPLGPFKRQINVCMKRRYRTQLSSIASNRHYTKLRMPFPLRANLLRLWMNVTPPFGGWWPDNGKGVVIITTKRSFITHKAGLMPFEYGKARPWYRNVLFLEASDCSSSHMTGNVLKNIQGNAHELHKHLESVGTSYWSCTSIPSPDSNAALYGTGNCVLRLLMYLICEVQRPPWKIPGT